MVSNSYVYKHTRLDTGEIFYIGIGTKSKQDILYNYYNRSVKKQSRNKFWNNIIRKSQYKIDIIFDNLTKIEAKKREIRLIKLIGRRDLGLGTLVNLSNGGEGSTGYKHSEEWKASASERMLGNKIMVGRKHSELTKKRISDNNYSSKNAYKIYQYSMEGEFIKEWNSVQEASNELDILTTSLYNTLNGKSKSTKGFIWSKSII